MMRLISLFAAGLIIAATTASAGGNGLMRRGKRS